MLNTQLESRTPATLGEGLESPPASSTEGIAGNLSDMDRRPMIAVEPPKAATQSESDRAWARSKWSLHVSERRLLLASADLAIVNAALIVQFGLFRGGILFSAQGLWLHVPWFLVLSGIWLTVSIVLDIYDLRLAADISHSALRVTQGALLALALFVAVPYITPGLPQRRLEAGTLLFMAVFGLVAWRVLYAAIFTQPRFAERALVIGTGRAAELLAQVIADMDRTPGLNYCSYQILAFVDPESSCNGEEIGGIRVLAGSGNLKGLAQQLQPDELVIALGESNRFSPELLEGIQDCRECGIRVTSFHNLFERLTGRVPVEDAGYALHVVMPLEYRVTYRLYLVLKRGADLIISLAGCGLALLMTPVIWLLNHWSNPGTLFYRQQRVGKGGKLFEILKFRSMAMNAEEHSGPIWATENDARVRPFGRFLRRTRLDEVPQFWNVLKGEMSLIGPRPERPEFVRHLTNQIPFYRVRHAVKPGITGWAQVNHRYGNSLRDALMKLQYDLYYIKQKGITLDLTIMLRTLRVVLGLKGT